MNYKVFTDLGEPVEVTPELEALVVAYVAFWVSQWGGQPRMQHPLEAMGLIIDFSPHL